MPVSDIFKFSRKTFFNPRGWIGYDELKAYNRIIFSNLKDLYTPTKAERTENFEQAMERLNLTEEDVQNTAKQYLKYTVIFVILSGIAFAAAFYLLIEHGSISGWMLAIASTLLLLVQAFRFHFWHFQIKYRTLGCTLKEWWNGKPFPDKETK